MPGYRPFLLTFFYLTASFLAAQEPERFVSQPVVSFGASETASRPQNPPHSQLHGFREALAAPLSPPQPLAARPAAQPLPQPLPQPVPLPQAAKPAEVRQVALSEPLESEPLEIASVSAQENDSPPEPQSSQELHSVSADPSDDFSLDQPIGLKMNEKGKDGKMEKPELGKAIAPVISVIGSLLIVLSAFFILMMMFRKMSPKGNRLLPKEAFENLGRSFLTPKLQLHLLRLGNRLILVSVTADGVTPVTEVTDPDEVVPLLGMCRALDANSSTALFQKMYANMTDDDSESPPQHAPAKKAAPKKKGNASSLVDLYSEPEESLADLLRGGVGAR